MMFSKQSEITKDKVWIEMTGTEQSRQQRKMNDQKFKIEIRCIASIHFGHRKTEMFHLVYYNWVPRDDTEWDGVVKS